MKGEAVSENIGGSSVQRRQKKNYQNRPARFWEPAKFQILVTRLYVLAKYSSIPSCLHNFHCATQNVKLPATRDVYVKSKPLFILRSHYWSLIFRLYLWPALNRWTADLRHVAPTQKVTSFVSGPLVIIVRKKKSSLLILSRRVP